MNTTKREGAQPGQEFNNCRFCPQLGQGCAGNAEDCLCLRCPRNLGQCLRVRYCRETESVLELMPAQGGLRDDELNNQLESYFKRME